MNYPNDNSFIYFKGRVLPTPPILVNKIPILSNPLAGLILEHPDVYMKINH